MDIEHDNSNTRHHLARFIVLQLEKRLEVLKLRLRLPFRSPAGAGSLHSRRSLRAPRGSTFFKLNGYTRRTKVVSQVEYMVDLSLRIWQALTNTDMFSSLQKTIAVPLDMCNNR